MSVSIEIDASDYENKIAYIQSELPLLPGAMLDEGSAIIEEHMRANIPVKTGRLRDSISRQVGDTEALVGTTAGYGLFVDEDTQPHFIRPLNGMFLRFEIDGVIVFAREVSHPGTTGQHFTKKTLRSSVGDLRDTIKRILLDFIERGIGT